MTLYGTVELGGTKTSVGFGVRPDDLGNASTFPTTRPEETIASVIEHLTDRQVDAVGIACFGPLGLEKGGPDYGRIRVTPKAGWSGSDIVGPIGAALGVVVGFDTDVNGAALGEWRWGAGRGIDSLVYVTVGTGIGGGALIGGEPIHGLGHPEMGHMTVRRHPADDFDGSCRLHGDCLEGLASGPSIEARFGVRGDRLGSADLATALRLLSFYLGQMVRNLVYVLAPHRVILGGGVAGLPGLLDLVGESLLVELAGYPGLAEHGREFITAPGLGPRSGLAGGLVLAEQAVKSSG